MKTNTKNTTKIQTLLDNTNGRADSHTFYSAGQIKSIAEAAVKHLQAASLTLKDIQGTVFSATSGSHVSRSYDYSRVATKVNFIIGANGNVFVTSAAKTEIYCNQGGDVFFILNDDQKSKIATAAINKAVSFTK